MKKLAFIFAILLIGGLAQAQNPLSVSVSGTINYDCANRNCYYNGPTILINEVMLSPSNYDGSMVGSSRHTSGAGEWIELYNPHKCDSIDISCYFLGNNAPDGSNYGGGFVLPQGTVVPPQGFCLVRGARASEVPSQYLVQNGGNVVEVVIQEDISDYCLDGGNRLWFPNAGGWFAFYDANGVPQDAISWCSQTNSCSSCYPCNPGACSYTGMLASYDQIPSDRKTYITSLNPQNYRGQSFCRIPDGGTWQSSPSTPTYAICNSTCIDPPPLMCSAVAVATATGGTPPYTYQWSCPGDQVNRDTAFALCAGTYTVTVTDAVGSQAISSVTIYNYEPPVSHGSFIQCASDSLSVLSGGQPIGGTYSGVPISQDSLFYFDDAILHSTNTTVIPITYTFADSNGCAASIPFTVTVHPTFDHIFFDTICQRETYSGYGFTFTRPQTDIVTTYFVDSLYQTDNQCDSMVSLYLTVQPSEIFVHYDTVCENVDYDNFGFTYPAGSFQVGNETLVHLSTNTSGCDSIDTLFLTIYPMYDLYDTATICAASYQSPSWISNIFQQNDFTVSTDTLQEDSIYMYVHSTVSIHGCDSTFTQFLHVLPIHHTIVYDTVCQYGTYDDYNFHFTENDLAADGNFTYEQLLTNTYGCDSVVTLYLTVNPTHTQIFTTQICEGESYHEHTFDLPVDSLPVGNHQFTRLMQNRFGCDSSLILNIEVAPVYDLYDTAYICMNPGNLYQENGFNISVDSLDEGFYTYQHTGSSVASCDSSFTLTLCVYPIHKTFFTDTICQGDSYMDHGFNITETGSTGTYTYYQHLTNAFGCDSTVELNLGISANPPAAFVANPERILLSETDGIQFVNRTDTSTQLGGDSFSWTWDFGDGQTESTTDYNIAHTYESWGEYSVVLTFQTLFGCTASVSHSVFVEKDLVFPNVITPNGDNVNDVFAIKNMNPDNPNVLSIYNRWGKKVYEKENYQTYADEDGTIHNASEGFDASKLSDGVYYYVFHYVGYVKAIDYHSSLTIIR